LPLRHYSMVVGGWQLDFAGAAQLSIAAHAGLW
jgi:hypothetical protein